eukprot:CAMPEP_0173158318 /NCGR_PEP_ID=MMETSP1105-20130129/16261_1 /TAXON_ID=2985 /ORGANISM="Ochromonas sp., Strain BG-1" /LENGTH=810 /DNA_ID=CAMNT_0014076175 /DNA_START=37 /DNA_END=2469 /DNA_ORIENTATION=+
MGNCQSANAPPTAGAKKPQTPPNNAGNSKPPSSSNPSKTAPNSNPSTSSAPKPANSVAAGGEKPKNISPKTSSSNLPPAPKATVIVANETILPPTPPQVSSLPPTAPSPVTTTVTEVTATSAKEESAKPKSVEEEMRKVLAISKIQKQARRKSAMKAAQAETQWKLFADLDTQDEAEMLSLAVFMQTLLDIIPNEGKSTGIFAKIERSTTLKELNKDEDDLAEAPKEEEDEDDHTFIKLKSINFAPVAGSKRMHSLVMTKNNDYDFCHMNLDAHLVTLVIELFRAEKKLSKSSVVKILRRSYKSILNQKNVTYMKVDNVSKITVVGDLHGQLADLLYIFDECGLPNENNKFIFNGDFVDRGANGFEVVFLILLMYVVFGPSVISLNRGNHEDASVCRVYGFEEEVLVKYDELMFEMFAELFNNLPLFSVINNSIFVVHGGLFHEPKVTLDELERIPRTDYFVKPAIPYPENLHGLSEEDCYREYLKQLQRDALWSDPIAENGCYLNHRGAGIVFGPNIAKEFMQVNNLSMVIRSHECVYKGFELPFLPTQPDEDRQTDDMPFLCTLFSASNYTDGDNFGAVLQFSSHAFHLSKKVGKSDLYYIVKRYRTTHSNKQIAESNKTSLRELVLKKKSALVSAFEAVDTTNCGTVTRLEWAEVMQRVTMIKILWLSILPTIAPAASLSPNAVNYRLFLEEYNDKASPRLPGATGKNDAAVDDFYGQRKKLETVFYFFDTNGDGVISAEEFRTGCALINKSLHPDCQLKNIDRMLQLMDFDGSGSIDINEFFETFRILDAKDGKVDGVISLAKSKD